MPGLNRDRRMGTISKVIKINFFPGFYPIGYNEFLNIHPCDSYDFWMADLMPYGELNNHKIRALRLFFIFGNFRPHFDFGEFSLQENQ